MDSTVEFLRGVRPDQPDATPLAWRPATSRPFGLAPADYPKLTQMVQTSTELLPSQPQPVLSPGPYRLTTMLSSGAEGTATMTWANLDAIFGLSSGAIDQVNLTYQNWAAPGQTILTLNCDSGTEYLLWRNPTWRALVVDPTNDPQTFSFGDNLGIGTDHQRWYRIGPYPANGFQTSTYLTKPTAESLRSTANDIFDRISLVVAGLAVPSEANVATIMLTGLIKLEPGGSLVLRYHRSQDYLAVITGVIAELFNTATIIEPLTRTETNERYLVYRDFRGVDLLPELIKILQPVALGQARLRRSLEPTWLEYWVKKQAESTILGDSNTSNRIALQSLYGWWAMPSGRWRDVMP